MTAQDFMYIGLGFCGFMIGAFLIAVFVNDIIPHFRDKPQPTTEDDIKLDDT